ncbi:hypothetical protein [Acinetobacter baumannii]|uniref:hypothetical protein n=1 Tax=Acinetobacter baumannii TaxID=470 RepID=UPI001BC875F7|nr:hypothetical protein [Acinetobacter baumannii]
MDKFEEDLREILAQSKHKSSGAERFVQASLAENKYPKDFLIYFINSECFGDYESELPAYEAWQHQQAKVEELQKQLTDQGQRFNEQAQVVKDLEHKVKCEREISLFADKLCCELQKRVDAAKQLIEDLNKCYQQDHQNKFEYWRGFADSAGILGKRLEQALKGEGQ